MEINIARDFSVTPAGRFIKDGPFSGEDFRKKLLEPHFINKSTEKITINFDGVEGYSTAFLEEAFGGLVRIFGVEVVKNRLSFISVEDPILIKEVNHYIEKAKAK